MKMYVDVAQDASLEGFTNGLERYDPGGDI